MGALTRLPKLRHDLAVKREVAETGVVFLLSAPASQPRRVTERVYRALATLDLYEDLGAWAAGLGDPELNAARLQQLLSVLDSAGLLERRGDTSEVIVMSPAEQSVPTPDIAEPSSPFDDDAAGFEAINDTQLVEAVRFPGNDDTPGFELDDDNNDNQDVDQNATMALAPVQLPQSTALARPVPQAAPMAPPQPDTGMVADPAEELEVSVSVVRESPEALRIRRRRRAVRLAAAGGGLAVVFAALSFLQISLTVSSSAELLPLEMSVVRSALDGVVAEVLVDEGQRVRAGDVLGRLGAGEHKVALARSEAAVDKARTELDQLRKGSRPEEVDRVRARVNGLGREVNIAGSRVDRLRQQVKQGIAPREELEGARAQHASLSGQLSEANAELRLLRAGAPPEEIAKKESELRTLEAQLEEDKKALAATELKSRMNGVIVTPKPKDRLNARVAQGDALFEIVESQRMKAEVLVAERDFDVLRVGLPLRIKIPAYPGRDFEGKVTRIAQRVEVVPKLGPVVRVEGEIENPEGLLVPNMTGIGEVDIGERPVGEILLRRMVRWFRLHVLL